MDHLVMNLRRSIIIAELWRPEVATRWKSLIFFACLEKTTPYGHNFQNSVPKGFIASPTDVLRSNFVKFGRRKIGKVVRYTSQKTKLRLVLQLSLVRGSGPKSSRVNLQECRPTQSAPDFIQIGLFSERVNTVRARSKVNPIFGWSLASRRIKMVKSKWFDCM